MKIFSEEENQKAKKKSTLLIGKHTVNIRPRIVIVRET